MPSQKLKTNSRIKFEEDEDVKYKLNKKYFENLFKVEVIDTNSGNKTQEDDNDILYKFPDTIKTPVKKVKVKPKIKVNFWAKKFNRDANKRKLIGSKDKVIKVKPVKDKPVNSVIPSPSKIAPVKPVKKISPKNVSPKNSHQKVRKTVSVLPSPLFTDAHAPMLTVPDDLTIHLDQDEANDLLGTTESDLGNPIAEAHIPTKNSFENTTPLTMSRFRKRKRSEDPSDNIEFEFFSKYIVQKLRKLDTNQRIYAENLINTVLMYGQLNKLTGKTKIE